MQSSKIEDIFNLNQTSKDKKQQTHSPLTYYQPFQSSFDPEFAAQKIVNRPTSLNIPTSRWNPGAEKRFTRQEALQPTWTDPRTSFPRSLNPSVFSNTQPSLSFRSDRSFEAESSPLRNITSAPMFSSWCNILGGSPDSTRPDERSFGSDGSYGFPGAITLRTSVSGGANRPGSSCSSYGGTKDVFGCLSTKPTQHVGNHQSSVYSQSRLMFGSSAKSIQKNNFKTGHNKPMVCNFCKNNKEVPDIYLNHYLHDPETKVLTCPVLRKHVCEVCGSTGDDAHTLQYCPVNRERGFQGKIPVLLKTRTITNSTGKIRRN